MASITPIKSSIAAELDEQDGAPLNFRVSAAFRREFRVYAAANDLKLNELLRQAFAHYRERSPMANASQRPTAEEPIAIKLAAEVGLKADAVNMNFRVSKDFRREFRRWAVDHEMQLNEALWAAFEVLKRVNP